jgi:hypothetical protein
MLVGMSLWPRWSAEESTMSKWENLVGRGPTASKPPSPEATGQIFYDTSLQKLVRWSGTVWEDCEPTGLAPTGEAGGDLSGSYPSPFVKDDSHRHTTGSLSYNHNLFSAVHPDVDATDVLNDGDILTYNLAAGKWRGEPAGAPGGSAGGDLTGTYPNPSVKDDSHNHTAATINFAHSILSTTHTDSDTGTTPASGSYLIYDGQKWEAGDPGREITFDANVVFDGGGAAIASGTFIDVEFDFACRIDQVTMLADRSGSITVDLWKDTYANFPPTSADPITGATPPTISASNKSQDANLVGWTRAIAAGDIVRAVVTSIATIQRVTLALKLRRT